GLEQVGEADQRQADQRRRIIAGDPGEQDDAEPFGLDRPCAVERLLAIEIRFQGRVVEVAKRARHVDQRIAAKAGARVEQSNGGSSISGATTSKASPRRCNSVRRWREPEARISGGIPREVIVFTVFFDRSRSSGYYATFCFVEVGPRPRGSDANGNSRKCRIGASRTL